MSVLCLHGYGGSGPELSHNSFVKLLKQFYKPVFLTALNTKMDHGDELRCWYHYKTDSQDWLEQIVNTKSLDDLVGVHDSLSYLSKYLNDHPDIECIFGYSQGAGIIALLVKLKLIPSTVRKLIFACGFMPLMDSDTMKCDTPSLHIMGLNDETIPPVLSRRLTEYFTDPMIVEHQGTHVIDMKSIHKNIYRDFLSK